MFNYANGFHVTVKDDKSEVLIQFIQTTPVLKTSESGKVEIIDTNEEAVSSVIMNRTLAEDLIGKISALFSVDSAE